MSAQQHDWIQDSHRHSHCGNCGLTAEIKRSMGKQGIYTEWKLGGMSWESRTAPVPNCPPRHP